MTDVEYWSDLVDDYMGDTKWIVVGDAAAMYTAWLALVHEKGYPKPFLIVGNPGTGDQPDPEHAHIVSLGVEVQDTETPMLAGIRGFEAALRNLPTEVIDQIRAWDPEGEAKVLTGFLDTAFTLDGRPTVGARTKDWLALEDKLTVDALWDAAGIPRAPSVVVALDRETVDAAHRELDQGSGTVWVCDNSEGWHGGGEYLRWVRSNADADDAFEFMVRHGSRIRVMPFLDGVPCSIHGMVFPEYVATFRPIELLTLREEGTNRLRYAGTASTWDPPDADRTEMREMAVRLGEYLRGHHDFRGVFTLDGVLTREGFRPTEVNPRFGAGLFAVSAAADLPLVSIHRLLIAEADLDYRPTELEATALSASDEVRMLRGIQAVDRDLTDTLTVPIRLEDGAVVVTDDEDAGHGSLSLGPANHGGVVMFRVDPEHTPVGVMAAPIVASALKLAAELWDLPFGDLRSATDVRS